jgi:hypothetical protein
MSLFHLHDTGSSRQVTGRLFERAAQLIVHLGLEDKQSVHPALYPVCLFDTSACGTLTISLANYYFGRMWQVPFNDCTSVHGAIKCRCTMRFWCYSHQSAPAPLSAHCNVRARPVLFKLRA